MHAQNLPFSAQLRRYKHLAKKVNRHLKAGTLHLLSTAEQKRLLSKLQERLKRIGHLVSQPKLKGALAGIALLLGTAVSNQASGQTFAPAVSNPFGMGGPTAGYHNFADLDGDGDLDLVVNAYDYYSEQVNFQFFENSGAAQSPAFTADNYLTDPFGIEPGTLAQPIFVDIDNDGDLDLFSGDLYNASFKFQENIGSSDAPNFAPPTINPFGLASTAYFNFATAADLDADGDIDILGGGLYGTLQFFENEGTSSAPSFGSPQANPFGISTAGVIVIPHLSDLDGDGDYDLLYMTYPGFQINYIENTGSASSPVFGTSIPNPFGIDAAGLEIPVPSSADIDGDGDMDVLIADYYANNVLYYENLNINVELPPSASDNSVTMMEDGLYLFAPADFNFVDGNAGDALSAVQITELPSNGVLKLGSTVVNGNQIILANELPNLIFDSDPNEFGDDYASFKFKVSDGGLWSQDDYVMSINVTAVNDAPVSQNAEVTGAKNIPFFFEAADFPYTDVEGDAFSGINILTLPVKGNLNLGGNAVTAGQNITAAEVGSLTFTPLPSEFGAAYASFDFQVTDGSAFSVASTMTINVLESSANADRLLQANVTLSPNPVTDVLNLRLVSEAPLGQFSIELFDAVGQKMVSNQLDSNAQTFDYQINTSSLASGFYFVKIEANGKALMKKFVKS